MGEHDVQNVDDEARSRGFMKALLRDVTALETMLERGLFESGVRRIGAEQEMFLVDSAGRPACKAVEVMRSGSADTRTSRTNSRSSTSRPTSRPRNTTVAASGGWRPSCASWLLGDRLRRGGQGGLRQIVLTGILPTLRQSDLGLENMTPNPRYRELNSSMTRLRAGPFSSGSRASTSWRRPMTT